MHSRGLIHPRKRVWDDFDEIIPVHFDVVDVDDMEPLLYYAKRTRMEFQYERVKIVSSDLKDVIGDLRELKVPCLVNESVKILGPRKRDWTYAFDHSAGALPSRVDSV